MVQKIKLQDIIKSNPPEQLQDNRSDDWPHYTHFSIDEKRADGSVRRIGQFYFGRTRVWGALPILSIGCNSDDKTKWCWIQPSYDGYSYAIAGGPKLVSARDNQGIGPSFLTAQALAELLGRKLRDAPPDLR
jgi:hypothetical protein